MEHLDKLKETKIYEEYSKLMVTYQNFIDHSVPFTLYRWSGFAGLVFLFMLRIILTQGWFIICYSLGIYLLNLLLAFLTPKFDPSLEQEMKSESIEEGFEDSNSQDEEFKPFIRRLPEFKFWYNATRAVIIAIVGSFFSILDIPVFWPILLMYFIILFTLTMRRQIQHMIKYRYLPFDFGKARYSRN